MQNNENQTQHSKSWCSQICCCKKKNKELIQVVYVEEKVEEKTENSKPKEIRFTDQIDIIENEIESFSESIIQHQQFIHNTRELDEMLFGHGVVNLLGDH